MKYVEYKIISGKFLGVTEESSFERGVAEYIKKGWEPIGGPCIVKGSYGATIVQAIAKRGDDER